MGSTDSRRNGPAAFADAAQRSIADIEARTMNESEIARAITLPVATSFLT
jgi:hypothetical protein